ncbi:hypothetical protein ABIC24_000779 [Methylobacterium radiotolerans]
MPIVLSTLVSIRSNRTLGLAAWSAAIFLATPTDTSASLAPLAREIAKATTGSPLKRAKVRGSSAVSDRVASSSRRTLRLPGTTMEVFASVSRLAEAASARIDCSWPPTSARPPAMSAEVRRSCRFTSAAVMPSASRRSGFKVTRISRATPPSRSTPPTPFTLCRPRATTSSTNHDRSSGVMAGAEAP